MNFLYYNSALFLLKEFPIVTLRNIEKIYPNGFHAIKNINLDIDSGDIYGIIGFSGAGKSTLIRIINLLEQPTSGEVIVNGANLSALSATELMQMRQKIGMIFQHFNLLSSRDVFGNVAFALEIAKWDKSLIKPRVEELLELVGLSDKAHYYPSELSGGQKQRVAIARALANHPILLLCDEATSALDTKTTKSILGLLRDIQARLGLSVILITHQIEVVKEVCNKMCVISNGEIIERGSVEEIFVNPKCSVTKELISYLPQNSDEAIIRRFGASGNVYKIIFTGPNAYSPLISQMTREFDIDVNILSGNIDEVVSGKIGHLSVEFLGSRASIARCLEWLKSQGVTIQKLEVSGDFVDSTDSTNAKDSSDSKDSDSKDSRASSPLSDEISQSHAKSVKKSTKTAEITESAHIATKEAK